MIWEGVTHRGEVYKVKVSSSLNHGLFQTLCLIYCVSNQLDNCAGDNITRHVSICCSQTIQPGRYQGCVRQTSNLDFHLCFLGKLETTPKVWMPCGHNGLWNAVEYSRKKIVCSLFLHMSYAEHLENAQPCQYCSLENYK